MSQQSLKTRQLILCALFAALTGVCSQILIPLPMIPINLALFSVHMAGVLLGAKYGSVSMLVYVLLGALGVPVFAGFQGGFGILFGKTGGYIIGYIFCALIVGFITKKIGYSFVKVSFAMLVGVTVCYSFGTIWFMAITSSDLLTTMGWCVFPFIPGDIIKIVLAALLSLKLRPIISKIAPAMPAEEKSFDKE